MAASKRKSGAAKKAAKKSAKSGRSTAKAKPGGKPKFPKPKLLSGDNPQIPKGSGNAPVKAYLDAIPGWKQKVARRIDALVVRTVPGVCKAVKWNSPLYGVEDGAWFLSFHCFTRYVKVTFFRGTSLSPQPPGASKHAAVRYYDVTQDGLDEKQFIDWVKQAAALPGERM